MNNEQLTQVDAAVANETDHIPTSDSQASTTNSTPPATPSIPDSQPSTLNSQASSAPAPQPSTLNPQLPFPRSPGETPRAYSAFVAFFQLGSARTLPVLAEKLGESPGTIKNWSSQFNWAERIQSFNSGLLQLQAQAETALQLKRAAEWAKRVNEFREQEWGVFQELLASARCFLQSHGDEQLQKMTLAQVSRAVDISSRIGRLALSGSSAPDQSPEMSPVQKEIAAALKRMYEPTAIVPPATLNPQPLVAPKSHVGGATLN